MPEKNVPTYPWFVERRNIFLISLAIFFFLSGITFFLCYEHYQTATERSLKEDRATANLLSIILEEHFQKIIKTMESYTNRPLLLQALKDRNAEKAKIHLTNLTKNNPGIDIVVITDKQGVFWISYPERPEMLGKKMAYRDWYQGISKDWKPYVSDVTLRISGEKDIAVHICTPFFDEKREVIGILVNTQRTVDLNNIIKKIKLDPGTYTNITDRKGNLVYSSRITFNKEITPYPFYYTINKAGGAGKNQSVDVEGQFLNGRKGYISFAVVANTGWNIFVERDNRSILISEATFYIQTTVITFLLFLMMLLSLVYFRKRIVLQQIMDQRQAEGDVRRERDQAKLYLDVAGVMIFALDTEGCIILVNNKGCEILGYNEKEILGQNWFDTCLPEEMLEEVKGVFNALMAGETALVEYHENPVLTKDGKQRIIAFHNTVLRDPSSHIIGILFSGEDVTERKIAEEKIYRLNEELEQRIAERTRELSDSQAALLNMVADLNENVKKLNTANKELEAFSYSVSHDLKAPLRAISGFAQIIARRYREALNEEARHYFDNIMTASERMGVLINELLEYSRVGRHAVKLQPVPLQDIITQVLDVLSERIKQTGADLFLEENLPVVTGDAGLLRQVFTNLLDNAIVFGRKDVLLRIEIKFREEYEHVIVRVIDNGIGIPSEYNEKIFNMFQRLHNEDDYPGTGIGLAIVRKAVNLMNGDVWVESILGEGSTFYIKLRKE